MRSPTLFAMTVLALSITACSGTASSSYRTAGTTAAPYRGPVAVRAVGVPDGAQQLGVVEVRSREELARAVEEFRTRVAELGGDLGVIDAYSTSFEMVSNSRQESYSCGTQQAPRTCTRTVTTQDEVATLHLVGRAMATPGRTP